MNTFPQDDEYDHFIKHLQIQKLLDEDRDNLEGPLALIYDVPSKNLLAGLN